VDYKNHPDRKRFASLDSVEYKSALFPLPFPAEACARIAEKRLPGCPILGRQPDTDKPRALGTELAWQCGP